MSLNAKKGWWMFNRWAYMLDEIHFIFRIQSDFHGYGINNKNSTVFRSLFFRVWVHVVTILMRGLSSRSKFLSYNYSVLQSGELRGLVMSLKNGKCFLQYFSLFSPSWGFVLDSKNYTFHLYDIYQLASYKLQQPSVYHGSIVLFPKDACYFFPCSRYHVSNFFLV